MPGRSDIAKQDQIRERMNAAQAGRPPGPATLDDVVAGLADVVTAVNALATLIGATNTALGTANAALATIAVDVDRIP